MDDAITVVIAPGTPPALDLIGPLDAPLMATALVLAAPCGPKLHRHTATHHTLHFTCRPGDRPADRPALAGRLADLLTAPTARDGRPARPGPLAALPQQPAPGRAARLAGPAAGLPASARQREVLLDLMTAPPGPQLHVGQLHLRWYGPLDRGRFDAAWQSVTDREAVLRAAFAPVPAGAAAVPSSGCTSASKPGCGTTRTSPTGRPTGRRCSAASGSSPSNRGGPARCASAASTGSPEPTAPTPGSP